MIDPVHHKVHRTTTCRKSLNPTWNFDFKYEVSPRSCCSTHALQIDDDDIQDEMFEVTVLDRDTLIGNDNLIGLVYVDLAPLVKQQGPSQA